jgi:class 3 adenylate cyclase
MSILVPDFVREKIERRAKNELIAETHPDVTIIFVDLYGFCSLIAAAKEEIVNILDEVFRTFDDLCTLNGIQKIETVGKTYMAAGGLKSCESWVQPLQLRINHTKRVINLAIAMMKYIKTVNWE